MARVKRASALLALLALACCARGAGAWPGSKKSASAAVPASDAAAPAAKPAALSHVDETGVNTYWCAPQPHAACGARAVPRCGHALSRPVKSGVARRAQTAG
jgi:hypothetical protein